MNPAKNLSTFDVSPHVLRPQQRRSLAARERLLRTSGIDDFSMAAVAQAASMPVGNIYRRFRSKDELIQAIKEDVIARIEDAVTQRLSQERFRDIPSLIDGFVGAVSEAFSSDESVHRFLSSRSGDPVLCQ